MKGGENYKISVITVSYNAGKSIEATLKNIADLHDPRIRHIVVDGNSTDGTKNVIKKYQEHLTYWISEPDRGLYDAMNKGWMYADEDSYILFLGCGDKLIHLPDANSFEKSNIIAGRVDIGSKYLYAPKTGVRLKLGNTLHHQALLIKKSLHVEPPFNLAYKTYADFDFNQRLYKAGHKIYIDKKFKGYALEGGLSAKFDKEQSLAVVRKNFGWIYMVLASIYYYLRHEI